MPKPNIRKPAPPLALDSGSAPDSTKPFGESHDQRRPPAGRRYRGSRHLFVALTALVVPTLWIPAIWIPAGSNAAAADWASFRGPSSSGVAPGGKIPDRWDEADVLWTIDLGGRDVGSPVITNGLVYLLASKPTDQSIAIECYALGDGKRQWSKSFAQAPHHLHRRNTLASSTPAVDDEGVVVAWADDGHTWLKSFDHHGKEQWSRDFGPWQSQHGFGTSPRIFGDQVFLMNSQQGERLGQGDVAGRSRMLAVDRSSGETLWETGLTTTRSCYGVPAIHRTADGSAQVINANTGDGLFGLDVKTGRRIWSKRVFSKRVCSTPLVVDGLAIGTSGSGGGGNHLVAVRIPDSGEPPAEVYRIERNAPYVPTPVVRDGLMFLVSDSGIASCVDVDTGRSRWTRRIGGNYGASPIVVGDRLLIVSLDGTATVLAASAQFRKIGSTELGGPVGATPAFQRGRLLVRVGSQLRCLGCTPATPQAP